MRPLPAVHCRRHILFCLLAFSLSLTLSFLSFSFVNCAYGLPLLIQFIIAIRTHHTRRTRTINCIATDLLQNKLNEKIMFLWIFFFVRSGCGAGYGERTGFDLESNLFVRHYIQLSNCKSAQVEILHTLCADRSTQLRCLLRFVIFCVRRHVSLIPSSPSDQSVRNTNGLNQIELSVWRR